MWTITKTVKKGDYIYGVCKDHPKASKHGYVLLHRILMENHIGRLLKEDEVVHHINHDKKDNRIENLQVLEKREHCKLHSKRGKTFVTLVCPNCKKEFLKEKRQMKKNVSSKCSRKCNGEYSRKLQLGLSGRAIIHTAGERDED